MSIKAVLTDDEKHNLDNLAELLRVYCPQVTITGTALNADEAKAVILKEQPGLLFLDIQMQGKNGFDLLKELDSIDFEVIFVTAHDQYAITAMRMSAVDYLLKPIDINDLQAAVNRAVERCKDKARNMQLENLTDLLRGWHKEDHRVALNTLKETRFVKTGDIIRCESSNNYTTFFLQGGEQLLVSKPIYEFGELLAGYGFIRCHQSHLVNRHYIKSWKKDYGDTLLLANGMDVPISRNRKEAVKKALDTV